MADERDRGTSLCPTCRTPLTPEQRQRLACTCPVGGWGAVADPACPRHGATARHTVSGAEGSDRHPKNVAGCCDGAGQVFHGSGALTFVTPCLDVGCRERRQREWDERSR